MSLNPAHVRALFNALRSDASFSLIWISTCALVEIINQVFDLQSYFIAFEAHQLTNALTKGPLRGIFVENLTMYNPDVVCRTELYSADGSGQYAYCFPVPSVNRRRKETRRSRRKHSSAIADSSSDITQSTFPPLPSVECICNPTILKFVSKSSSDILIS